MRFSKISVALIAILALIVVFAVPAVAKHHGRSHGATGGLNTPTKNHGRLYGITGGISFPIKQDGRPYGITCGHHPCHFLPPKHKHRCKKHDKCHRHHRHTTEPIVPPYAHIPHVKVHPKTGPFCDPHIWVTPPEPDKCPPDHVINDSGPGFQSPEPEEPFEATEMKMRLFVDNTITPATESTWGCAKLQFSYKHNIVIRFLAIYGGFQSSVWGGSKGPAEAPFYCSEYIPPPHPEYVQCSTDTPRVIDTAWAVMIDRTTHEYVESEQVKFYIDNPEEEVGDVHCPVG